MKKIKKTGLNRNVKKILSELSNISKFLISDVIASNFNLTITKQYLPEIENYEEAVFAMVSLVLEKNDTANFIVMELKKYNDMNVKDFLNLTIEELKEEFDKGIVPAYHNAEGISSDMLIFYYITHNLPKDEKFKFAVEYNLTEEKEYSEYVNQKEKEAIHIKGLEDTLFEESLNEFYYGREKNSTDIFDEVVIQDLCTRYKAEYLDGKLLISPQILKFYDNEASQIINTKNVLNNVNLILMTLMRKTHKYLKNTKDNVELYRTIENLTKDNNFIKNENKFLKEEIAKFSEVGTDKKEVLKLEQENYYLKAQLEKLKAKNKELEDTIFELKEIQEDLTLTVPKVVPTNIYSGEKLIIVGGHWHKRDKDKLRKFYLADFIEVEDIMKYTERIKNYDFVIFDTSRNSHTNYNRVKNLKNLRLISKSKKESIDDLFLKSE